MIGERVSKVTRNEWGLLQAHPSFRRWDEAPWDADPGRWLPEAQAAPIAALLGILRSAGPRLKASERGQITQLIDQIDAVRETP